MFADALCVMASFSSPMEVPTNPQSLLWLIPLTASLAFVYKATKLPKITVGNFIKESATLLASIVVFLAVTALVLYGIAWLVI